MKMDKEKKLNMPEDGELLSFFPGKKVDKEDDEIGTDDTDQESESLYLLEEYGPGEGDAEVIPLWEGEEPVDIEEDLIKLDSEPKSVIDLREVEAGEAIDDPVHVYLHEIGKVPLLTAKEDFIIFLTVRHFFLRVHKLRQETLWRK